MKRIFLVGAVGALIIAVLAVWWGSTIDAEVLPREQIILGESAREYRLVVPRNLPRPMPVVFAFHGTGDSTESMAAYSQLDRLAAANGFLLVYPAGRKSMWFVSSGDSTPNIENPDLNFFDELLTALAARYAIDRSRVYLVGMSNGATFAQLVAAARPNVVAALVAHSGSQPASPAVAENGQPILLIVGADDAALNAMRADATAFGKEGRTVELIVVPGLGHVWSARHNRHMWWFLARHTNQQN